MRNDRIGPPIVGVFIAILAVAGVWIAAAALWWAVQR